MTAPVRTLMRAIISWSLNFRFLVVGGAIAMLIAGISTVRNTPVDVFPEFAPPQVEVQTESLGLSTSDVESLVTTPLELALNGMPGLQDVRSTSVPQLSSIVLVFNPGTDLLHDRQLVQERLSEVKSSLPTWASPPVILPPVSATARVLQIGMWSDRYSLVELSRQAYWNVKSRLLRVPGVADVSLWNERQPTYQVRVDPARMAARGVTLDDVEQTESDALDSGKLTFTTGSVVGPGGFLENGAQRLQILHTTAIRSPADLAAVPLARQPAAGGTVRLGDIGSVVVDNLPIIGDGVINGHPGLLLVVEKLPWGNTLDVTRQVDAALAELKPGLPGVDFDANIFRPATFIDDSIHNLSVSLLFGFALVVAVLLLFLFEWRVALVSLLTIPLSLTAALLVLHLTGQSVNTMILTGLIIALGAVVDDAIIDVENILRRLRQTAGRAADGADGERRPGRRPVVATILEASLEVRSPIVYATLIIVAAAVPVFLLQGLTAAFFRPLALAYALAITASMAVALTVTPALTCIVLKGARIERRESPIARSLRRGYAALLGRIVVRPTAAYLTFSLVVVLGALAVPGLNESLFPTFKQRDLLIHWDAIPGTSDDEMVRTTTRLSRELLAIPGVHDFGAHIGRAQQGEEIVGINAAEIWISVDPGVDYDTTVARVRAVVGSYPGLYRDVETYLNERIEEVLTGAQQTIDIRVYGQDLTQIRAAASTVLDRIATVPGLVDQHEVLSTDTPQLQIQVDQARATAYGLKPGDVRRQVAALVAGTEVGNVFQHDQVYGAVTWSEPSARHDVAAIGGVLLDTATGGTVPLRDLATVSMGSDPYLVTHENGVRYIDVGANVQGGDLSGAVRDIQARLGSVSLPGARYSLLGEYTERQAAQRSLLTTALIAGAAILLLLQLAFGTWRLALLSFLTLPMALVGGVLAIWLAGGTVTIGALVGFFTVFGIAARNGILLINHCQHLEEHEGETFGPALVVRGARERLAPIVMTSLATGLALVPLVFGGDQPGHEIEYPLAVVILGGLVTSTLLTLFVAPSLYLRFGRRRPPA